MPLQPEQSFASRLQAELLTHPCFSRTEARADGTIVAGDGQRAMTLGIPGRVDLDPQTVMALIEEQARQAAEDFGWGRAA